MKKELNLLKMEVNYNIEEEDFYCKLKFGENVSKKIVDDLKLIILEIWETFVKYLDECEVKKVWKIETKE